MIFRHLSRRVAAAAAALAVALSTAVVARAMEPALDAELACAPVDRAILCVVSLAPSLGAHITWADALIVNAPSVARPVNWKAAYREGQTKEPRLVLLLAPSRAGSGEIQVRTRAVVCADDGKSGCPSFTRVLRAIVRVPRAAR